MNFLNAALLGGAVAFLAPLLIHLLNRSRFQSVDWGAMHLLETAMQVNSKRTQWERLLLLLVRCLIPILLAACLARPVLTAMRVPGSQGSDAFAFILDDSLSMRGASAEQESTEQAAKDLANDIADRFPNAEMKLLLASGRSPAVAETLDGTSLDNALRQVDANAGSVDFPRAISTGVRQLAELQNPSKQLVIISDFQSGDWATLSEAGLNAIRDLLTSEEQPIQLSLVPISMVPDSDAATNPSNLSARFTGYEDHRIAPDVAHDAVVYITNNGSNIAQDISVRFLVDGKAVANDQVTIAAGQTEVVACNVQFNSLGWHHLECDIQDEAGPAFDNVAHRVVHVEPPWRVLVVSENAAEDESEFVELALAPFATTVDAKNRFQVSRTTSANFRTTMLRPKNAGDAPQLVVLSGLAKLRDDVTTELIAFVEQGGGLVVFPGSSWDVTDDSDSRNENALEWSNRRLYEESALLPMAFGMPRSQVGTKLLQETIQFQRLSVFNSADAGDLWELEFESWMALTDAKASATNAESSSLESALEVLRFSNGDPFLVTRRFGRGQVMQFAVACSQEWSNLPLKPVFVPLMQQTAISALPNSHAANFAAGDSIPVRLSSDSSISAPRSVTALRKNPVEGSQKSAESLLARMISPSDYVFDSVLEPGIYQVELDDDGDSSDSDSGPTPPMFAVSAVESESSLTQLNTGALSQLADRLGATVVRSPDEFSKATSARKNGQEIWRWLLLSILALLFCEILLSRVITKGGR